MTRFVQIVGRCARRRAQEVPLSHWLCCVECPDGVSPLMVEARTALQVRHWLIWNVTRSGILGTPRIIRPMTYTEHDAVCEGKLDLCFLLEEARRIALESRGLA